MSGSLSDATVGECGVEERVMNLDLMTRLVLSSGAGSVSLSSYQLRSGRR